MKQKLQRIARYLLITTFVFLFVNIAAAKGALLNKLDNNITDGLVLTSGFNTGTSVGLIIANIITIVLSLLGIIFVILVITSGFGWMTAGGNDEKIKKSQERLKSAIIGLIIIVAAYAITYFIFKQLPFGSNGGKGAIVG